MFSANQNAEIVVCILLSYKQHFHPINQSTRAISFLCNLSSFDCPTYLSSLFLKRGEIRGRATRNSQLLNIPLFKIATGQRKFSYRTVSLWNSLDSTIKLWESISTFKRKLRKKLLCEFLASQWYLLTHCNFIVILS